MQGVPQASEECLDDEASNGNGRTDMSLMDKSKPWMAIDIETASQGKRAKDFHSTVVLKAPKNFKDQEKIDANIAAQREALGSKDGLTWHTGKVISFAWEVVDTGVQGFFFSANEAEVLKAFTEVTAKFNLIGKESKDFDFPFLRGRYMANKIAQPSGLMDFRRQYDCNDFLGNSRACGQRLKLDYYAHALGIEAKTMKGSGVRYSHNG